MIKVEQVALRTDDIQAQVEQLQHLGHVQWIRDTVEAVHLFKDESVSNLLGDSFKVHLAFNYDFIVGTEVPREEAVIGIEFEVIQLISGYTWQLFSEGRPHRISHLGYHTKRDQAEQGSDSLMNECLLLQSMGLRVMQISQTVAHANTQRRYRYAFVTGDMTGGIPLKIIQRLLPKGPFSTVEQGRKLFACLANP